MIPLIDSLSAGAVVLDGGLGTLLEARGHDLTSSLWSARLLLEEPAAIRAAHREFFDAGARVAITASYQVSYDGLARQGVDESTTTALLQGSVAEAVAARDSLAGDGTCRFVAASIGPYGASLADGSEYRGDYGLSVDELAAWHRRRVEVLAGSGADLLAVETIPCLDELVAITRELRRSDAPAWVSVTIAGGALRSGESLAEAFAVLDRAPEVVAVGVNCSDPAEMTGAIRTARGVTGKPIVLYPNSGERWDAVGRRWLGEAHFAPELVREWRDAGAAMIGGCCRVGPAQIAAIAATLRS